MKKLLSGLFLILFLLLVSPLHAQTRYLVGVSGRDQFDNLSAGILAGVQIPVKRVEFDFSDTFSPIEDHIALGYGTANAGSGNFIFWVTKTAGIEVGADYSTYAVTAVSKGALYASSDLIFKRYVLGFPSRVSIGYVQQFNNGIVNGVETSHLTGLDAGFSARVGSAGPMSFRVTEDFQVGRVLTQGNPVCDGTLGNGSQAGLSPCPRTAAFGGGIAFGVVLEFPRRRGHENDLY